MDEEFKQKIKEEIGKINEEIKNKKNECYRVKYNLEKLRKERNNLKKILAGQSITGRPKKDEKVDVIPD